MGKFSLSYILRTHASCVGLSAGLGLCSIVACPVIPPPYGDASGANAGGHSLQKPVHMKRCDWPDRKNLVCGPVVGGKTPVTEWVYCHVTDKLWVDPADKDPSAFRTLLLRAPKFLTRGAKTRRSAAGLYFRKLVCIRNRLEHR